MRSIFVVLGFCVLGATAFAPAAAATTSSAQVSISGWKLECDPVKSGLACRALDEIVANPGGGLVISFTASQGTDGKTTLTMQVPLGAAVSKPIQVELGSKQQAFPYLTCSQQGCFAAAELDDALLASMRSGTGDFRVSYFILDSTLAAHAVTATLSLQGFGSVYDKLK